MTANDDDGTTEVGALVRLGLKVALGERGTYLAEYLDDRRLRRAAERIEKLGEWTSDEGAAIETVIERVHDDDEAAEIIESIVEAAARTRYEPKIRYLARCLANFLNGSDGATPDLTSARVLAVSELGALHVQVLHGIQMAQAAAARRMPRPQDVDSSSLFVSRSALEASRGDAPLGAAFHPVMATLLRTGLVESETDVDVEVEISLDVKGEAADASPMASTTVTYRNTALGLEVLAALAA